MARKVVLAGACRTAIGVMGGQFANTSAVELRTIVIKEALKRAGVSPDQVDEVYMGNVIQAGNGQNPARQALYMQESRMKYRQQLSTYFVDPVFTV